MRIAMLMTTALLFGLSLPVEAKVSISRSAGGGASFVGVPDTRVSDLLKAYPNGGPDLTRALEALLESDPTLANDAVFLARGANADIKLAIAAALAAAFSALQVPNPPGAGIIRQAMLLADQQTRLAFEAALVPLYADAGQRRGIYSGFFTPGLGGNGNGGPVSAH